MHEAAIVRVDRCMQVFESSRCCPYFIINSVVMISLIKNQTEM